MSKKRVMAYYMGFVPYTTHRSQPRRTWLIRYCTGSISQTGFRGVCQGFRETEIGNGGGVLLAVGNLEVRIKLGVTSFSTDYSVTDSNTTIFSCFNPEAS